MSAKPDRADLPPPGAPQVPPAKPKLRAKHWILFTLIGLLAYFLGLFFTASILHSVNFLLFVAIALGLAVVFTYLAWRFGLLD